MTLPNALASKNGATRLTSITLRYRSADVSSAALAELVGVVRALADRFRSVSEHASHQRQTAVSSFYAETADRLTAAADRAEAL